MSPPVVQQHGTNYVPFQLTCRFKCLAIVVAVMDPFAGGVASLMMASTYLTTNLWMAGGGSARLATAAHIGCWLAQFYGHAAHEGRAPALLDNLFQARRMWPWFSTSSSMLLCTVVPHFALVVCCPCAEFVPRDGAVVASAEKKYRA